MLRNLCFQACGMLASMGVQEKAFFPVSFMKRGLFCFAPTQHSAPTQHTGGLSKTLMTKWLSS